MSKDTQSRKYLLTINNPSEKGMTQDKIKEILTQGFESLIYYCMSDEIGGNQNTYHTHLFLMFSSPVRFTTIKRAFSSAHIDRSRGTAQENRDYVFKIGRWKDTAKSETNLLETHYEQGELPEEKAGRRSDLTELYQSIQEGMTNSEILENYPQHMVNLNHIDRTRRTILEEKYRTTWRNVIVTYIFGQTGIGKTRTIMETFGYENVYRITNYNHPFDGYNQQSILLLDEYNSQINIHNLLNYLDGYPLSLPCRYADKVACFDRVFIISNLPLQLQHQNIQQDTPNIWSALLRRINGIYELTNKGFLPFFYHDFGGKQTLGQSNDPMSKDAVIKSNFITFTKKK
jgi:hypothetical protein